MKYLFASCECAESLDIADSIEEAVAEARSNSWARVYVYTSKPADFWSFDSEDYFDEERNFTPENLNAPIEESWTSYWGVTDEALAELNSDVSNAIKAWAERQKLTHFYYADQLVHTEVLSVEAA